MATTATGASAPDVDSEQIDGALRAQLVEARLVRIALRRRIKTLIDLRPREDQKLFNLILSLVGD